MTCNLQFTGLKPLPTRNDDDMNEELEIPDRIIRNATLLEQAGIINYGNCSTHTQCFTENIPNSPMIVL